MDSNRKNDIDLRQQIFALAKSYAKDKLLPWDDAVEIIKIVSSSQMSLWQIRTNIKDPGKTVQILIAENDKETIVVGSRYLPQLC